MNRLFELFEIEGHVESCTPYGNGHINRTYLVRTDSGRDYILQRINTNAFPNVVALMGNIAAVTNYLRARGLDNRHVLTLVPTTEGGSYVFLEDDDPEKQGYYRVYDFVTDSLCLEMSESAQDFRRSALAFGEFQMQLKDFSVDTLQETIPKFHDTVDRYRKLRIALDADKLGRAGSVARELDFVFGQEVFAKSMQEMLRKGDLPLRVTHNDTKLNNVLFDLQTRQPLCVIDLDTVMPGLSGNDFGDSIRYGASSGAEDELDLSKIEMRLDMFEAYTNGFLSACGKALTPAEIEMLPMNAKLMTLECGVRFLTDYLEGDVYFRIHRENHNLDRARTQFKLVADMNGKWDKMQAIVRKEAGNI